MCHVKVDKGTWRRHAHQLRQDRSHYKDFDIPILLPATGNTSEASVSTNHDKSSARRYPLRNRKPAERYGVLT